ncbi:MAG: hypothetical protein O3C67_01445 [Cyanobacteria bacterium]|nr:hypothetical protein [Cyanobacteriota bacterium]
MTAYYRQLLREGFGRSGGIGILCLGIDICPPSSQSMEAIACTSLWGDRGIGALPRSPPGPIIADVYR